MKKQVFVYIILIILLIPLLNCGKKTEYKKLPPTLYWEQEQASITTNSGTRHIWSGLTIKNNFFVPKKAIAKFVVWKEKSEKTDVTFNYLLKGKPVDLFINSIKTDNLKPRYKISPVIKKINLSKGFNFIEFRIIGNSELKIKSMQLGTTKATNNDFHIPTGEQITRFHSAGSGSITLEGKGKLQIQKIQYIDGKKEETKTEIEAGFMSGSQKYAFDFATHGYVQLTAVEGNFNIADYQFQEKLIQKKLNTNKKIATEKPHVFIFLIDGCHAGHLGLYGYHRDTTPNIDQFAKDSVVFDNAYANATFTRSSVATIFTGFHPHRHKLRILTNRLPKGLYMLPEFMQKTGYKTALLTEAGNISRFFGFSQGVDHYRKVFRRWDDPRYLENNTYIFFNKWIKTNGSLFTYVHYRAPHFPIIPPPPFLDMYKDKKYGKKHDRLIFHLQKMGEDGYKFSKEEVEDVINDYDSTIRYVDDEVGKLIVKLKQKKLYDSSLIIFTSDHGEALYEHGYWGHGTTVYNEASQVPLVVKFPDHMNLKGLRVETLVQLADIFPTIAEFFGEKRYFDGRSLMEAIETKNEDDSFAYSTSFGTPPTIGIRWRSWHYIIYLHNNSEELFNLKVDPITNVVGEKENKELVTFFRAKFLDWYNDFDNLERTSQSVDLKKLPKEEYENLKSLGYIN